MSRALRMLRAADVREVQDAVAAALSGDGPAVLPIPKDAAPPAAPTTVPTEVALVVSTSGSTGEAKLVALSAEAMQAGSASAAERLGGPGQWLLALPAHYIAGLNVLARSLAAGTELVMVPAGPFDPTAFAEAASTLSHERRFTSLVPAQLGRLLESPEASAVLRSFTAVLVGGQGTPQPLLERSREVGVSVVRTYVSSETAGGCVYDGVPLRGTSVEVVDCEVQLAGPTLALGYLDDGTTRRSFVERGGMRWFRTGDTGVLTGGTLTVTGRLDDQIVSGGVNVSLGAVETSVRRMPGLADAVVVSRASERWGRVPVVVCSVPVELGSVRAHVSADLGRAAAPEAVVVLEALPMLASGKPDRLALAGLVAH